MSRVYDVRLSILFLLMSFFVGCSGDHGHSTPPPPAENINALYGDYSALHTRIVETGYPLDEDPSRGGFFARHLAGASSAI